jgi:Ni,Fe-hydrogenase III small subunit
MKTSALLKGFKLVDRRDRWGLTRSGWLFGLTLMGVIFWGGFSQVHGFFAVNQPLENPDLLIVEGWITDDNTKDAIQEFRSRPSYKTIITTGTQLPRGYYLSEYKTFAELSRASLVKMGIPEEQVIAVSAPGVPRDRSYTSAVALADWLEARDRSGGFHRANLLSESVHARRSWTLFKRAIAGRLELGVISVPTAEYEADRWWTQSEGFKRVMFEGIAWFYVTFFNKTE